MNPVQVIVGPPGSGKSTYCSGISQICAQMNREVAIINLDPCNESMSYDPAIDVMDLINLEDVMESLNLGPNGGMLYCIQFMLDNIDWLEQRIIQHAGKLILMDCPGQIELYSQDGPLKKLLKGLEKECNLRVVIVNLVDSNLCGQPSTFISATLVSLSIMTNLEFPQINVLSKIDTLKNYYSSLRFNLDFYTNLNEISRLINDSDTESNDKYSRIGARICEVLEDFSLVSYHPFSIEDKELVLSILRQVDRASGCGFVYSETFDEAMNTQRIQSIVEKYS
jgi:GTPase SAR1 family protein